MEMGFLSALNGPLLAELEKSSRSNMLHVIWDATGALTTVAASYHQIKPSSVRAVASCRNSSGRGGVRLFQQAYLPRAQLIGLMVRLPASVTEKQLPTVLYSPASCNSKEDRHKSVERSKVRCWRWILGPGTKASTLSAAIKEVEAVRGPALSCTRTLVAPLVKRRVVNCLRQASYGRVRHLLIYSY
ncbi:hypothetical protein H0G86_007948 [Trichoderma simmonsii]|uniref:Uncharacterized protein n=1 Tax=Trichoderma simmonsii TaxID=1491479 RepID=A0A8G0LHH2_9HYPO|nr:hypothetical protein H0G86_007948 [Trichoderma simmonsii]